MVAIIRCSAEEAKHIAVDLETFTSLRLEWTWRVNRPRAGWHQGAHLTLIVADDHGTEAVRWLGWASRLRRSGDLDRQLEISRVEPVTPPVPLPDVISRLDGRHARHVVHEGQQSPETGRALIKLLGQVRPELRDVINRIEAIGDRYSIGDSPALQIVALQRDATIGVARMAGIDASDLARWDRPQSWPDPGSVPPPFTGMLSSTVIEDRLIDHDARTMLGWFTRPTADVSWTMLEGLGQQRLLVVNANRTPAEKTLGIDLIYYNATRKSMVMVQYKKLSAARHGFYYPDSDQTLDNELNRMRKLDELAARNHQSGDDYRLTASPTWIKLCHPQAFIPQTADMVPGLYLPRDQFEQLRKDPRLKGPQGGVRFGYDTVPSYLDNTLFTRLVEIGFIGTTGTSTDIVHEQVRRSLDGGKALVAATLSGQESLQSKRNSERRRGR
jgi:hypothetical protein